MGVDFFCPRLFRKGEEMSEDKLEQLLTARKAMERIGLGTPNMVQYGDRVIVTVDYLCKLNNEIEILQERVRELEKGKDNG